MQYKANSVNCVCEYIQHLKDIASTNDITSSDALKQVWLSRVNYHTHCTQAMHWNKCGYHVSTIILTARSLLARATASILSHSCESKRWRNIGSAKISRIRTMRHLTRNFSVMRIVAVFHSATHGDATLTLAIYWQNWTWSAHDSMQWVTWAQKTQLNTCKSRIVSTLCA